MCRQRCDGDFNRASAGAYSCAGSHECDFAVRSCLLRRSYRARGCICPARIHASTGRAARSACDDRRDSWLAWNCSRSGILLSHCGNTDDATRDDPARDHATRDNATRNDTPRNGASRSDATTGDGSARDARYPALSSAGDDFGC